MFAVVAIYALLLQSLSRPTDATQNIFRMVADSSGRIHAASFQTVVPNDSEIQEQLTNLGYEYIEGYEYKSFARATLPVGWTREDIDLGSEQYTFSDAGLIGENFLHEHFDNNGFPRVRVESYFIAKMDEKGRLSDIADGSRCTATILPPPTPQQIAERIQERLYNQNYRKPM